MKHSLILVLILSIFIAGNGYSQNNKQQKRIKLQGLITDSLDYPIPNATIFVDGKKVQTTSNAQGRFKLKLKSSVKSIAVFTLVNGYAELEYQDDENVTFVLSVDNSVQQNALNIPEKPNVELVNVGYETVHKRNLTSGVGNVKKGVIEDAYLYSNIYDMIRGKIPGVSVSGTFIKIRGTSTVNGNSAPLLIVNGSPVESIYYITPNSVKSISVLKGPSAAIYGSRGANGVVLITLKTGNDN